MLLRIAKWLALVVVALVVVAGVRDVASHGPSLAPLRGWVIFVVYAVALAAGTWRLRSAIDTADRPLGFLAPLCIQLGLYAVYWAAVLAEGSILTMATIGPFHLGLIALVLAFAAGPIVGYLVAAGWERAGVLLAAEFLPWLWGVVWGAVLLLRGDL